MTTTPIKPRIEAVALHPDVISENFSEDIFALALDAHRELNTSRGTARIVPVRFIL